MAVYDDKHIYWHRQAIEEYVLWEKNHRAVARRINRLIADIKENGLDKGIGKPKMLKWDRRDCWSRRITEEHRLLYDGKDGILHAYSCATHYE
jgi:toxin YoeB